MLFPNNVIIHSEMNSYSGSWIITDNLQSGVLALGFLCFMPEQVGFLFMVCFLRQGLAMQF